MLKGEQMKKLKRIYIWTILVSSAIIFSLGLKASEILVIMEQLEIQIRDVSQEIYIHQIKLDVIQQEQENMNNIEYIESVAREKLGMVKKEDIIFKLK
ncbi:MAG: hypothetical protein ATN36_03020 [Epulopiscium sp. Nele67-Bin005]|nr:MAG: hypothetical protein ATN36_03020 [Epulopiscium sp. Nele67-Bin005]